MEHAAVGDLLKASSLALCCDKYSYTSSFDKSAREWLSIVFLYLAYFPFSHFLFPY